MAINDRGISGETERRQIHRADSLVQNLKPPPIPRNRAVTNFSKDSKAQMNTQEKRVISVFILGVGALP